MHRFDRGLGHHRPRHRRAQRPGSRCRGPANTSRTSRTASGKTVQDVGGEPGGRCGSGPSERVGQVRVRAGGRGRRPRSGPGPASRRSGRAPCPRPPGRARRTPRQGCEQSGTAPTPGPGGRARRPGRAAGSWPRGRAGCGRRSRCRSRAVAGPAAGRSRPGRGARGHPGRRHRAREHRGSRRRAGRRPGGAVRLRAGRPRGLPTCRIPPPPRSRHGTGVGCARLSHLQEGGVRRQIHPHPEPRRRSSIE